MGSGGWISARNDRDQLPPLVDVDPVESLAAGTDEDPVVALLAGTELFVVVDFLVEDLVELSEPGALFCVLLDPVVPADPAVDEVDEEPAAEAPVLIATVRMPPPTRAPVPAAAVAHLTRRRTRSRDWMAVDLLVVFIGSLSRLPLARR
jgi:hypothetical protein